MAVWDDPDVGLLYEINGIAEAAPTWADRTMEYIGEYGIIIGLVLLGLLTWWRVARRKGTRAEAVTASAGLVWAPGAAAIALLVNIPIRGIVERPRPFLEHKGLEVLIEGKEDYSFVSDHSTLAMALAVGIFMVHRRYGLLGIVLAVFAGASRVYMGVHYPTDVIGGLALGAAVALLLAPVAIWALTPLMRSLANSPRMGAVVWVGPARRVGRGESGDGGSRLPEEAGAQASGGSGVRPEADGPNGRGDRDLAA